jgi:hypothetical protein
MEKMIQGLQGLADKNTTSHSAAVQSVLSGFGEQDIHVTALDFEKMTLDGRPTACIRFGPSTSFLEAGRRLEE